VSIWVLVAQLTIAISLRNKEILQKTNLEWLAVRPKVSGIEARSAEGMLYFQEFGFSVIFGDQVPYSILKLTLFVGSICDLRPPIKSYMDRERVFFTKQVQFYKQLEFAKVDGNSKEEGCNKKP